MKSVITLILVLLIFTYSHATDSTDNIYKIEGIESIPRKANVDITLKYQFQLIHDNKLSCPDWHLYILNEIPIGDCHIDFNGIFHFKPKPQDAGKDFQFKVMTILCGEDISTPVFSVHVADELPLRIQMDRKHHVLMEHHVYVNIKKVQGDISIKELDFTIGFDKDVLRFDSVYSEYPYEFEKIEYKVVSDSADSIQLVNIKAIKEKPISPKEIGSLLIMKLYAIGSRDFECEKFPISFVWTDCKQNYLITENKDTIYLMVNEQDYHNVDYKLISYEDNSLNSDYYLKPLLHNCYKENELLSMIYAFYQNGSIDHDLGACWIDDLGDINLNGIQDEIADADLLHNYFLYGPSVFDIALEAQLAASDKNNDKIPVTPADLVCLLRKISCKNYKFNEQIESICNINASYKNGNFLTNSTECLGAVWVRFKPLGEFDIFNESDMQLDCNENEGELKVLVWTGLENLNRSIPCGENKLFRIEGDVKLIAVEASDQYGNVISVEMEH